DARVDAHRLALCGIEPALRSRLVLALPARVTEPVSLRCESRAGWAFSALAPCADRLARHRLRSARRARAEPGRRRHGLHVRDAARRVPRGECCRRVGVSTLACEERGP